MSVGEIKEFVILVAIKRNGSYSNVVITFIKTALIMKLTLTYVANVCGAINGFQEI